MKTGMIFLAGIFIGNDAVNIVLESGKLIWKIRRVIRNCGGIIYSEPEKVSCRFSSPGSLSILSASLFSFCLLV